MKWYSIPDATKTKIGKKYEWTVSDIYQLIETGQIVPSCRPGEVTCSFVNDVEGQGYIAPYACGVLKLVNGRFDNVDAKWKTNLRWQEFNKDEHGFRKTIQQSVIVTADDLIITQAELDRYDAKNSTPATPEPAAVTATEPRTPKVTAKKPFGGAIRKGNAYTPEGRFMDCLLKEYRTQYMQESEDFKLLTTFITTGMKSKSDKWEVIAIDKDCMTIKIKRTQTVFTMAKLEKLWEKRKEKHPFKADQ